MNDLSAGFLRKDVNSTLLFFNCYLNTNEKRGCFAGADVAANAHKFLAKEHRSDLIRREGRSYFAREFEARRLNYTGHNPATRPALPMRQVVTFGGGSKGRRSRRLARDTRALKRRAGPISSARSSSLLIRHDPPRPRAYVHAQPFVTGGKAGGLCRDAAQHGFDCDRAIGVCNAQAQALGHLGGFSCTCKPCASSGKRILGALTSA